MNFRSLNFVTIAFAGASLLACHGKNDPDPAGILRSNPESIPVSLSEADHMITLSRGFDQLTAVESFRVQQDKENFDSGCGEKIKAGSYAYTSENVGSDIVITSISGLEFNDDSNFVLTFEKNKHTGAIDKKAKIEKHHPTGSSAFWIVQDIHSDADGKLTGTLQFSCYFFRDR